MSTLNKSQSLWLASKKRKKTCSLAVTADREPADLDGRFAGDVGHQEVHGDVLTVDVLVHHVPDGHGHHVRVQVGVVLQAPRGQSETQKTPHTNQHS